MRTSPDLEAAILANPDDDDAYLVYGDWLQHQGEAVGRLVAIQHALARIPDDPSLLAAEEALLTGDVASFFGPPHPVPKPRPWQGGRWELWMRRLRGLPMTHPVAPQGPRRDRGGWSFGFAHTRWHDGFIREVQFSCEWFPRDEPFESMVESVAGMLGCPSARFVRSIGIEGLFAEDAVEGSAFFRAVVSAPCADVVRIVRIEGPGNHLPQHCNASALWDGCPRLEEVVLQGLHIEVGTLGAPTLRRLALQSCGMSTPVVRAVDAASVPALEDLELWIGLAELAEAPVGLDDLATILRGDRFPALRRLGLMNCEFGDDICRVLPTAPVLPRLRQLDLTMGVVTDAGAQVLLEHAAAFDHLDLAISGFFSDEIAAALSAMGARVVYNDGEGPPYYVSAYE